MIGFYGDRSEEPPTPGHPPQGGHAARSPARGVVTWDLPIGRDGLLPRPFLDQLAVVGKTFGRE